MSSYSQMPTEVTMQDHGWFIFGGFIAVTFGILALFCPVRAVWMLALLWAGFALADSIFSMSLGLHMRKRGERFWPYLLVSMAGLLTGLSVVAWRDIMALELMFIITAWSFVTVGGRIIATYLDTFKN